MPKRREPTIGPANRGDKAWQGATSIGPKGRGLRRVPDPRPQEFFGRVRNYPQLLDSLFQIIRDVGLDPSDPANMIPAGGAGAGAAKRIPKGIEMFKSPVESMSGRASRYIGEAAEVPAIKSEAEAAANFEKAIEKGTSFRLRKPQAKAAAGEVDRSYQDLVDLGMAAPESELAKLRSQTGELKRVSRRPKPRGIDIGENLDQVKQMVQKIEEVGYKVSPQDFQRLVRAINEAKTKGGSALSTASRKGALDYRLGELAVVVKRQFNTHDPLRRAISNVTGWETGRSSVPSSMREFVPVGEEVTGKPTFADPIEGAYKRVLQNKGATKIRRPADPRASGMVPGEPEELRDPERILPKLRLPSGIALDTLQDMKRSKAVQRTNVGPLWLPAQNELERFVYEVPSQERSVVTPENKEYFTLGINDNPEFVAGALEAPGGIKNLIQNLADHFAMPNFDPFVKKGPGGRIAEDKQRRAQNLMRTVEERRDDLPEHLWSNMGSQVDEAHGAPTIPGLEPRSLSPEDEWVEKLRAGQRAKAPEDIPGDVAEWDDKIWNSLDETSPNPIDAEPPDFLSDITSPEQLQDELRKGASSDYNKHMDALDQFINTGEMPEEFRSASGKFPEIPDNLIGDFMDWLGFNGLSPNGPEMNDPTMKQYIMDEFKHFIGGGQ